MLINIINTILSMMMLKKIFVGLIIISMFFYQSKEVIAQANSFDMWIERSGLFTTGKKDRINIYIRNSGTDIDSYTIGYGANYIYQTINYTHYINVDLKSDRITNLQPGRVSGTTAILTLLGPVRLPGATITITVTSDSGITRTDTINIIASDPISLPEFNIAYLLTSILIISAFVIQREFSRT